jgi:type I restriction enzyme S subunit
MSAAKKTMVPKLRFQGFNQDWKTKPLKALSHKPISYGIVQTGMPVENGVRCVRVVDLTRPRIDFRQLITTSHEISQSYKKTILAHGELMVALRGEIGLVAAVPKELEGSNLTRGIARIAPKEAEVQSSYLLWALRAPEARAEFLKQVNGSALKEIPIGGLNKIEVQLPTLPEQQKIADFLTAVDGRIQQLSQKKALLQDYKTGVMQQLFTQSLRFKDDDGNDFPDWEEKALGEIANIKLGKMLDKTKHTTGHLLPYLNNISLRWNEVDTSNLPQMYFRDNELDRFGLRTGDVVVCEGGEPGRSAVWDGRLPDLKFQKAIHRVRFKVPFEARLLVLYLEHIAGSTQFEMLFTGGGIKHLTRETFSLLKVPFPSHVEQTKIANFLTALGRKIESVAQQIELTQTFKRGLLQQMFV